MVRKWGPVIVWMALIFALSAQSHLPSPHQRWLDFGIEKLAHTLEYAVLAALLARALESAAQPWHVFRMAVLIAALYALSDELHQRFVPGRNADWTDIVADWLGAAAGAGLWLQVRSLWQKTPVSKEG